MDDKQLRVTDSVVGSVYAQVVNVNAASGLVTLDFIYVHPRMATLDQAEGQVVARITMPLPDASNFSEVLAKVLKQHTNKLTER